MARVLNTSTKYVTALLAGDMQSFDYVLALAKRRALSSIEGKELSRDVIDDLAQQALLDALMAIHHKHCGNEYQLYNVVTRTVHDLLHKHQKDSADIVHCSDVNSFLYSSWEDNSMGERLFGNNYEEERLIYGLDVHKVVETYQLSHPDSITARILEVLSADPDMKPKELAHTLGLDHSTIRNALKRLRRTLLERKSDPTTKLLYREDREAEIVPKCTPDLITIDDEMIRYFQKHPSELYTLNPRRFEELIAAILKDLGYSVELTALGADGGIDIFATQKTGIGEVLLIVDCKRYLPENHVGVGVVRALYGIGEQMRATMAMLQLVRKSVESN